MKTWLGFADIDPIFQDFDGGGFFFLSKTQF